MISLLVYVLVILIVTGILAYLVGSVIPMPSPMRIAAQCVVGLLCIVLLLGVIGALPGWRFGHI